MNNASGSSVSRVRIADAAALAVASLLALSIFLLPHTCAAASSELVWGDVAFDSQGNITSDDRISIQDGETYAVQLNTSKSVWVQNQAFAALYGELYLLSDSGARTFVGTYGAGESHTLSWTAAGRYELDVYQSLSGPVLGETIWEEAKDILLGKTAYAQTDEDLVGIIRFTITDQAANPPESNILFIPGTESSRLYQDNNGSEQQVWEPNAFSNQPDVQALDLNPDGTSITPTYTKADGAIDTAGFSPFGVPVFVQDVYKTFLQQLVQLKASSTINDYLVFPYDWRMSPEDVVSQGTLYDDGVHHLDAELVTLASTSQTGKVTIIAHSNGGLVTKALMNQLVQEGKSQLVDKIIFVAVPQDGTPKALAVVLNGDLTGIPPFVVSQQSARTLVENMPDAYDLLPSAAYFARVATPVIDLTDAPELRSTAGFATSTITNSTDLRKFLTGVGGRQKPAASDIETPDVLSASLLSSSTALHADLDSWQPPTGIQVIQIAGWGIDTVSGLVYTEASEPNCAFVLTCTFATTTRHTVTLTEEGDGTVVTPSSIATTSWPTYYINLGDYNTNFKTDLEHANITETSSFQKLLALLLASSSPELLPTYVTASEPKISSTQKSLRLRVLSPVSLDAYDSAGNHTGIAAGQNSQSDVLGVDEQIPGSYYQQYGEGQYIGLPADGIYRVVLHGESTGTFTFQVTSVIGGTAGMPVTFADIPVTASSSATIALSGSNPASTTLALDVNGDGVTDVTIASSSQTTDPLAYAKIVKAGIAQMDIGNPVQKQLQAKFTNVIYLLSKIDLWDADDDDAQDTSKADKVSVRVIRKFNKIEAYVGNEVGKPVSKRIKDERITQAQAVAVLGMIEELKMLVNTKL